ncbi:MAG: polysaccharide biosynthesis/export family protein [Woeseiaceae bacterium]|nr:polysaccharide biosynthesis/export family protein [Woeseiaceae bacterium]
MKILTKLHAIAAVVIVILACAGDANAQESNRPDASYKILPGDVLQVSVWKEPDLQLELLVRPDGAITFPLAGEISSHNKSVTDLQAELTARLARFITDPVVTVSVRAVLGNKVYVIGQVNRPGEFVVNPQVDVLQALSMAGGTTPFADVDNIRILRRTNSVQTALSFNYKDVIRGRHLEQNVMLQSGDVVVVP